MTARSPTTDAPASAADTSTGREPLGLVAAALTLLTVALWGGTPVAIKYSVVDVPPVAVAGIRFAMAAVFMLFWCGVERTELRLRTGQFVPALVAGSLLFVQISLFNVGVQLSNSSHGTLLINTFIFWVVAVEHFVTRHDRLNGLRLLGLSIAAGGVVALLVFTDPTGANDGMAANADRPTLAGDLVLLVSGCVLGIKVVYTKHAVSRVEPGKLIFWHDVIGVAYFAAWSAVFEDVCWTEFGGPAIWGLLYQGVCVAGFCFVVQAHLLKRHSASSIAVFSFATPLFGITLAVLFRGDALSPWLLLSGVCVAAGILLVNVRRTP